MPTGVEQENGGIKVLAIPEVGEIEADRLGRNGFRMLDVWGDKPSGALEGGTGIRTIGKRRDAARGETQIVGLRVGRTPTTRRVLMGKQIVSRLCEKWERFAGEVFQHYCRSVYRGGFVLRALVAEPKGKKRAVGTLGFLEKPDASTHRLPHLLLERGRQKWCVERERLVGMRGEIGTAAVEGEFPPAFAKGGESAIAVLEVHKPTKSGLNGR